METPNTPTGGFNPDPKFMYCKCGKSNAELNGLSLRHVAECVRQAPLESYTIGELKSGFIHGFPVKPPQDRYDPDAHIETKSA